MHGAAGAEEHPEGRVQRPVHSLLGEGDHAISVSSLFVDGEVPDLSRLFFDFRLVSNHT